MPRPNRNRPQAITIFQDLHLSADQKDGLIRKVICKTGETVLSPGPGQTDVEKPLRITDDLFKEIKLAFDDQAMEHVTIPPSHANSVLENTGFVKELEIIPDPKDGKNMLVASMDFRDEDVKKKCLSGAIANTSVGVVFNFRRKTDGKKFPAVLEHVALTNQPWVGGLKPFGEAIHASFGGTFVDADLDNTILLGQGDDGILSRKIPTTSRGTHQMSDVNTVLAEQTATIEEQGAALETAQTALHASQERIAELERGTAREGVDALIAKLQNGDVPPVTLKKVKMVLSAEVDREDDSESLNLSFTPEGKTEAETLELSSAREIVEFIFDGMPTGETTSVNLSHVQEGNQQKPGVQPSAGEKATAIEQKLHPERFDESGQRITKS